MRAAHLWARALCDPELVCEVAFREWTLGGEIRHPSFQRVEDRPAQTRAAGLAGEAADHRRPPLHLLQRALEQVRKRYERRWRLLPAPGAGLGRMVRPCGTGALRTRGYGQADLFDELKARVSK